MNILFIGDIVGKPGRQAVAKWLPEIRKARSVDFVVANGENAAGGLGANANTLAKLREMGVDAFTMGNHVWQHKEFLREIDGQAGVVRPANFPPGVPGVGHRVLKTPESGVSVGLLNVQGRVFMQALDCPFRAADAALGELEGQAAVVLVDVHAEATAEKIALGWYLDGRVSAVVGTHTHVPTADERVLPQGTAYISDVGMCGPRDGIIGVEREPVMERFLRATPAKFDPAKGPLQFNAVCIEVKEDTGKAAGIERIHFEE